MSKQELVVNPANYLVGNTIDAALKETVDGYDQAQANLDVTVALCVLLHISGNTKGEAIPLIEETMDATQEIGDKFRAYLEE